MKENGIIFIKYYNLKRVVLNTNIIGRFVCEQNIELGNKGAREHGYACIRL